MNKYAVSVTLVRQNTTKNVSVANFLDTVEAPNKEHANMIGIARALLLRPDHDVVHFQAVEIVPEVVVLVLG